MQHRNSRYVVTTTWDDNTSSATYFDTEREARAHASHRMQCRRVRSVSLQTRF